MNKGEDGEEVITEPVVLNNEIRHQEEAVESSLVKSPNEVVVPQLSFHRTGKEEVMKSLEEKEVIAPDLNFHRTGKEEVIESLQEEEMVVPEFDFHQTGKEIVIPVDTYDDRSEAAALGPDPLPSEAPAWVQVVDNDGMVRQSFISKNVSCRPSPHSHFCWI